MLFEFDPAKDEANQSKHGVSLRMASEMDWDSELVSDDERKNYGEARQKALLLLGNRLHMVAFVDRGDSRRIISLRKANLREVMHYAKVN